MSLVTFQFEDGTEYDLRDPGPRAVVGELERMGSPAAVALAGEVKRAGSGKGSAIVKPGVAVDRFLALLRALDHIKNGAKEQPGGEAMDTIRRLLDLRHTLYMRLDRPLVSYELTTLKSGWGTFASYSGPYEVGDRLVTPPDGSEWKITLAKQPTGSDRGQLAAALWHRAAGPAAP